MATVRLVQPTAIKLIATKKNMQNLTVGFTLLSEEFRAAYAEPIRHRLPKDTNPNHTGFLSCPAVRSTIENTFEVCSPFSLKLRAEVEKGNLQIKPVYPFTSVAQPILRKLLTVEDPRTWRHSTRPIVQIVSPFVFYADEPVLIEQFDSSLSDRSKLNWRIIPGKFDIYAWQRPVNWAFEWDTTSGDFEIRLGETQYCVKFTATDRALSNQAVTLEKRELTAKLKERLQESAGISKVRRGTMALLKSASGNRSSIKLLE